MVEAFDGPVAEDLGGVVALVELGSSDANAWRTLHDHPQFGPAADDLARSVDSGILVVEALRQHAIRARQTRQAALQVRARAVGVQTVLPLMVCFIPSFLLLGVVPSVVSALTARLRLTSARLIRLDPHLSTDLETSKVFHRFSEPRTIRDFIHRLPMQPRSRTRPASAADREEDP